MIDYELIHNKYNQIYNFVKDIQKSEPNIEIICNTKSPIAIDRIEDMTSNNLYAIVYIYDNIHYKLMDIRVEANYGITTNEWLIDDYIRCYEYKNVYVSLGGMTKDDFKSLIGKKVGMETLMAKI